MPKTSLRLSSTSDTKEARLMALENFTPGAYVRHKLTGQMGLFCELNLGYALPEVWVQFESHTDICVPTSCNPLDLELLKSTEQQMEEISSKEQSTSSETVVTVEATATIALVMEELTEEEASERQRLELKVERAFYEAGLALRELRNKRLYRSTHKKFEDYCRDRFRFSRDKADLMIKAVGVVDNLKNDDNCRRFLPTSESQVRDIADFAPTKQCQVYAAAVKEADGKVPPRRIVKGVIERLKEKSLFKATDFCQIGDVFTLVSLDGTERKYNSCWAITLDVRDFTVEVDVYDGTISVKPENLKPIDDPDVRRQLPQTLKRIKMLRNVGVLDRGAYYILEGLGRQTYLTDFEDKLLTFMEQEYGITD